MEVCLFIGNCLREVEVTEESDVKAHIKAPYRNTLFIMQSIRYFWVGIGNRVWVHRVYVLREDTKTCSGISQEANPLYPFSCICYRVAVNIML